MIWLILILLLSPPLLVFLVGDRALNAAIPAAAAWATLQVTWGVGYLTLRNIELGSEALPVCELCGESVFLYICPFERRC